jgi:hypothetical protein
MSSSDKAKGEMQQSKFEKRKAKIARWTETLWARFSHFDFRFSDPLTRLPWRVVLGAGCLLFLGIWLHEHDARLRHDLELQQLKQQTWAQVADLRTRAEAALREANQKNARVIADLEARRRQLAREGEALRKRLLLLREDERQRVSEVAALPASELAERLKARVSGLVTRDSELKSRVSGLVTRDSEDYRSEGPSPQPPTPAFQPRISSPELRPVGQSLWAAGRIPSLS